MLTNPAVKKRIRMDNRAKAGCLSEHDFSVWIESKNQKIYFDAGGSDALTNNAERMSIDLSITDYLVLSHCTEKSETLQRDWATKPRKAGPRRHASGDQTENQHVILNANR